MAATRLNRYLALAGLGTRRSVEGLVRAGKKIVGFDLNEVSPGTDGGEIGTRLRFCPDTSRYGAARTHDAINPADALLPLPGKGALAAPPQPNGASAKLARDSVGGGNRLGRRRRWRRQRARGNARERRTYRQ